MTNYSLEGEIIDSDLKPMEGLKIRAYDDDPWLNADDLLGKAITDSDGAFEIEFDESKFKGFWEFLEGTPDVYLIVEDDQGNSIMKTRVMRTKKELHYHIRVVDHTPDPNAKDIYASNLRRIMNMLGEVGNIIGMENTINLDTLRNGDLLREIKERLHDFVDGFGDRISNFNHFMALLSGLVNEVLEETRLRTIGYDGPQVPRHPRLKPYNQAVIWPMGEELHGNNLRH